MKACTLLACVVATLVVVAIRAPLQADTVTAMGDRGGEGPTAFTGLAQAPEANLFTGTLGTSVALDIPPGRQHVTPQLALQYSSAAGPSPFGFGWDLPLGRIERSTKWGTPRCTGPHTDDFILVLPSGTVELKNDPPGSSYYRPVVEESYLRAEKFTAANYWEVRDRSGLLYVFGRYDSQEARLFTGDGSFLRQEGELCHLTTAWALLHVEDPNGNSIDVSYWTIDNVFYPVEVRYGGNVNAGLSHAYSVNPLYYSRPDVLVSHHGGVESRLQFVAHTIVVYSHVPTPYQPVRNYSLTYDQSGALDGYRSMLSSVQATGYPAQVFTYADSLQGFAASIYTPPTLSPYRLRRRDPDDEVLQTLLDMNGDGFVDLVRWVHQDEPWRVYPGGPNGFSSAPIDWDGPVGPLSQIRVVFAGVLGCPSNRTCSAHDTFDLTGDGIPDYVVAKETAAPTNGAGACTRECRSTRVARVGAFLPPARQPG